jgi:hypothetical protein
MSVAWLRLAELADTNCESHSTVATRAQLSQSYPGDLDGD